MKIIKLSPGGAEDRAQHPRGADRGGAGRLADYSEGGSMGATIAEHLKNLQ